MADYKKTKEDKKRRAAAEKRIRNQRNKLDYDSYPVKNKQVDKIKGLMDKQKGLNPTVKTSYS